MDFVVPKGSASGRMTIFSLDVSMTLFLLLTQNPTLRSSMFLAVAKRRSLRFLKDCLVLLMGIEMLSRCTNGHNRYYLSGNKYVDNLRLDNRYFDYN